MSPHSAWTTTDITALRSGILAGKSCEEIALEQRRAQSDVRDMAGLLGLSFCDLAQVEWCDRCCQPRSRIDPDTGWCDACTAAWRLEQQREADAAEEERLREEVMREENAVKKQRQRMREIYSANPRKGRE